MQPPLKTSQDGIVSMARLCGDGNHTALPATFMSTENHVVVKFKSEMYSGGKGSRFKLKYERLNCSGGTENGTCGSGVQFNTHLFVPEPGQSNV